MGGVASVDKDIDKPEKSRDPKSPLTPVNPAGEAHGRGRGLDAR